MEKPESGIIKTLNSIECVMLIVMFVIMVSTSFMQVLNRNWLHLGLSWLEETARFAMIYMVMLGTEMGLRDGTQISVTGFVDLFKGRARRVLAIVAKSIVVVFSVAVFLSSFSLLAMQVRSGQITPTLKIPMYIPYAAVTIGFGLTSAVQIAMLAALVLRGGGSAQPKGGRES